MSTIGVTYHHENIRNIIRKPVERIIKSPRYISKRIICTNTIEKQKFNGRQNFGLAHYDVPETKNFLKKGKPKAILPAVKLLNREEFKCTIAHKPPIPKYNPDVLKREKKNYIKENIKRVLSLQPKVPVPRRVDTPRGTTKELAHLLQMIKIRQSEEYGKIPQYLDKRRRKWEREKEIKAIKAEGIKKYKEKMGIGTMGMNENVYMIDQETRQRLLDGLKENWNELSKQFLRLPVMTDTLPKLKRKMWLEKEIEQLEKDVRLVETHPYIYLERYDKRPYSEIVAEEQRREKEEREKARQEEEAAQQQAEKSDEKQESVKEETTKEEDQKAEAFDENCKEKTEEDNEVTILPCCAQFKLQSS